MSGGSTLLDSALRIAQALYDYEARYQAGKVSEEEVQMLAKIFNYDQNQLLNDMHNLKKYLFAVFDCMNGMR